MSNGWRPLDAADRSWCGLRFVRVFADLDLPPVERVTIAARALLVEAPELAFWFDGTHARRRAVRPDECDEWVCRVIVSDPRPSLDVEAAVAINSAPLEGVPYRLVIGPDWVSMRSEHAVGDGWTVNHIVGHLLRRAGADGPVALPWTTLTGLRRDTVVGLDLAHRPRQVLAAARDRHALAGGSYEPAPADRVSGAAFPRNAAGALDRLRAVRDEQFPGLSVSAIAEVGIRAALGSVLPPLRPGFECLFNIRAEKGPTARALGNWSSGVYLRPADDTSPTDVAAAMKACRAAGLPQLASASLRVKGWRRGAPSMLAVRSERAPRLTFSYAGAHALVDVLPGVRPGTSVRTATLFNGRDTLTFEVNAWGSDLHSSLSFDPTMWDAEAVRAAVDDFLLHPDHYLRARRGVAVG